ncbi:MAG: YicC family protein [Candidatus Stahlbacteria bacterium]|nr:MAG: YicC family protein [Candidatus Stahlbacteria bacterium]
MRSMTAFTNGSIELYGCQISCNLHSFNSRFLDINITVPEVLHSAQTLIYEKIREKIKRGRVEMTIYIEEDNYFNSPLYFRNVESYIEQLKEVKKKFNLKGEINISMLSNLRDIYRRGSIPRIQWEELESFIGGLLEELLIFKEREGGFMQKDLMKKIQQFKETYSFIKERALETSEEQKEKILKDIKRLNDLDIKISRDDINLFAFKGDVNEELVRLKSHIDYFEELLVQDGSVGRRLRFLLQEMAREVNTIGAKAYSAEVVHYVIDLKEFLDEMREQVENIE